MKLKLVAALLAAIGYSGAANAIIIGGGVTGGNSGGSFVELTLPLSGLCPSGTPSGNAVGNDCQQSPNLFAFNEGQNLVIATDLTVDQSPSGGSATIPANTVLASHYVFFDPQPNRTQEGFVDFDAEILGIVTSTANLTASDFFIPTGVAYLSPGARGLEGGDSAIIDPTDPNRVLVDWRARSPGDYIRVLTAESPGGGNGVIPLPEPAMLTLLGLGLLLGGGFLRRRQVF